MLMPPGVAIDLIHLGLGHITAEDPAKPFALRVDREHHLCRLRPVHGEEVLQYVNDKLHGSKVVVNEQDLVHRRTLQFRFALLNRNIAILQMLCISITHLQSVLRFSFVNYRRD